MIKDQQNKQSWDRAVILVDMNAFFASVEQLDYPELRKKPIAVTNGDAGTCIITCSYEARSFGIKTGMRIKEAKKLCSDLIKVPSRPERYVEISTKIMEALEQVTPDIEIFSIDEAFLDVTNCQHFYNSPVDASKRVKQIIAEVSGLPCSVGLSGDKITAKYAAESVKPNGFTVIFPWDAEKTLARVKVIELCGIGRNISNFLAGHGIIYCGDMKNLPIEILTKRFGNLGRKMWLMCQGKDTDPVHTEIAAPKSIGHGKVLPPGTKDLSVIKTYFRHMAEKVAARLRQNNMYASKFFIGMLTDTWGWLAITYKAVCETQDGQDIYAGAERLIKDNPEFGSIRQVQITAINPKSQLRQIDMFEEECNKHKSAINATIDSINEKYGDFAIMPATLIDKTKSGNVIAPSWRPKGIRKTV